MKQVICYALQFVPESDGIESIQGVTVAGRKMSDQRRQVFENLDDDTEYTPAEVAARHPEPAKRNAFRVNLCSHYVPRIKGVAQLVRRTGKPITEAYLGRDWKQGAFNP